MKHVKRSVALLLFLALAVPAAFAQGSDAILDQARIAYRDESFEKAFALVADGIPETSTEPGIRGRSAEFLSGIGLQEYSIRNFKNAYEAFRKALKYDPTNAQATTYFLKMRREMDVTNLANEAPPRAAVTADAGTTAGPAGGSATTASGTAPAATQVSDVELTELKGALEDAGARLRAMETSVSSTSDENKILKAQVDQQLTLIQTFIEKQAAASSAAAKPGVATAPAATAQEKALIAQTVELIAKMSEQETALPQIVMQSDPALKDLVERLAASQENLNKGNPLDLAVVIAVSAVGVSLFALVLLLVVSAARAKKRAAGRFNRTMEPEAGQSKTLVGASYAAIGQSRSETPLLEFIESAPQDGETRDLAIRRDLLKAERLNRMYEEVRTGSLGWNTVRQYIGELEVSLRSEILKTVERKLDEGDLVAPEAILPVIFPFLTDYDDFVREKSEKLARRALLEARKGGGGMGDGDGAMDERDLDPMSVKNLMDIPRRLQALFKNQDQTLMTAKICRGMGAVLGLSPDDRNLLYKSALAHDCGYLMLDRDRLARTIAKQEIDDDDFDFIRSHAAAGISFFGEIELPAQFKGGLVHHHERNDGSGYPDGLRKDEIPLFGKLIGVAETFAALVSKRSYRDKRDVAHALAIISDGARSKFDAAHVEALVKVASSMGTI